jgi:hypothetical protein
VAGVTNVEVANGALVVVGRSDALGVAGAHFLASDVHWDVQLQLPQAFELLLQL